MAALYDRVNVLTATPGTGTVTLGAATGGGRTFAAAGVPNGVTVSYLILDGTAWEVGTGVYNSATPSLTRPTLNLIASSTGSLLNLTGSATVAIAANAGDFVPDVYPPSNFGPRYRSWLMDPNEAVTVANNAGPFGGRYFLAQEQTVTWSRVLIPSGNGRVALRRQITSYSPQDAGFVRGQSNNNFILDPDAGAVWRWKARVNLRPNGQPAPDQITNRYVYVGGFSTWSTSALFASNSALFRYYYDTSGESAALVATTRRNGTGQTTGVNASLIVDGFVTLEIVLSATQVLFYINGALVATHATVPDGALNDGDGFWRDGHTGTVIMDLAYMATSVSWGNDA